MRYYWLSRELNSAGAPVHAVTYLGLPQDLNGNAIDPCFFTSGRTFPVVERVVLPIEPIGPPPDVMFAAFEILVVRKRVVRALEESFPGELQKIAVSTGFSDDEYEIVDVVSVVPCVDRKNSEIIYLDGTDGGTEKLGDFGMVLELVVDSQAIEGRHFVRPKEWGVVIVVSERVKSTLESLAVSGVEFWPATK